MPGKGGTWFSELMPKLSGIATTYLNGSGAYTTPAGGGGSGDMTKAVYDTNGDNIVDVAASANSVAYANVSGKPATFPATAHATSHNLGGADVIAPDWTLVANKPATFTPAAHQATHLDNGTDPIPVATSLRTGLAPKLSGTATTYLDGTGAYSTPAGGGAALPGNLPGHTTTTASFTASAAPFTSSITVADASWIGVGLSLYRNSAV
jgi:hypothetical protein